MEQPRRRRRGGPPAPPTAGSPRRGAGPRPARAGSRPAASRPTAARRRPASGRELGVAAVTRGAAAVRRRVPSGLTGRAAVLGLVVCALVLSLAYPLKEYLAQRAQLARLEQQRVAAEHRVAALEARRRQVSDPAYIKAQARKRLQYVLPGESVYVVVAPSEAPPATATTVPGTTVRDSGTWYDRLWGTVRSADGAAAP
jgi:cell division protein FtsB